MNSPNLRNVGIVNVTFGRNVTVVQPANLYGCEIGDDSFVGPFVEIQRNVRVGRRCRIQSHAFVCERVTLGDEVFVSHGAMFINDLFKSGRPNFTDASAWGDTVLGAGVVIGTHATILPVSICAGTVIGAGAVVTKPITVRGIYAGNPAKLIRSL
jgi:acetyltransferase-like isoleucine patch superfamily enzyme